MPLDELTNEIPDLGPKLNPSLCCRKETLGEQTKYGLFLACAVAARNPHVMSAFEALVVARLSPGTMAAARAAASLMAMSNV